MKRPDPVTSVESPEIAAEVLLTSHQVSELLQVNPSSVNNWVRDGRLLAFRTPGGHRRIKARDLAEFLSVHRMPIPKGLRFARKRRVLLVDDDVRQLNGLARLLEPHAKELEVQTVDNGIDALMIVATFEPHLIVMDLFMPEVNGLEVCRRLRANPKTAHIEVIVASGNFTDSTKAEALEAGAQSCLEKPIDPQVILRAVGLGHETELAAG